MSDGERSTPVYLPADAANGCPYCFDPASQELVAAFTRPPPRPETTLPSADLAADLRFLHRLLRQVHAGYPDWQRCGALDVEAFFTDWQARLEAKGDKVDLRQGVIEPLSNLRRFVPDNHFTILGADSVLARDERLMVTEYQFDDGSGAGPIEINQSSGPDNLIAGTLRTALLLRSDGTLGRTVVACATGRSDSLTISAGGRMFVMCLRPVPAPSRIDRPIYEWRMSGETALITLRRFGGAGFEQALGQFVDDYPEHARAENIVFDLRGNNGGTLEYISRWIARAKEGPWQSYPRLQVIGPLWWCANWNRLIERQIVEGRIATDEAAAERQAVMETWSEAPPPYSSHLDPGVRQGRSDKPYTGRIFVLIDRQSGSSGELAAFELKRALGAVLLGERSYGCMQYGQVLRFVLPRTGLISQIPTKKFFFEERVESVGLPVDVYLDDIALTADGVARRIQLWVESETDRFGA